MALNALFGRKKEAEEQLRTEDQEILDQLDALQQTTEQVEAEKEAKRLAREEKKFLKAIEKKKKERERLVAPFILMVTIFVSMMLWLISQPK